MHFPKLLMQRLAHQKRKAEKLEAELQRPDLFDVSYSSGRHLGFREPVP